MPKIFTSLTQKTGELGEEIAVKFFRGKGYKILERNHTRKWGEIDIIGEIGKKIHFIEVKAILLESSQVPQQTIRPEDNMHPGKMKRFMRTIETYLAEKRMYEADWQADLLCVYLNKNTKEATVKFYADIS